MKSQMNDTIRALIYRIDGTFITPPDVVESLKDPPTIPDASESMTNPPFVFIGLDIGGPEGDIGVITTREL